MRTCDYRYFDFYNFGFDKVEDRTAKVETLDDKSLITIDVPGYNKCGAKIVLENNVLLVYFTGKRGDKKYKFKINELADIENITSKMEDGVLEISVPKSKEKTKEVKIE